MPGAFFLLFEPYLASLDIVIRLKWLKCLQCYFCSSAKGEIATYAIQFSGKSHMLYVVEKPPLRIENCTVQIFSSHKIFHFCAAYSRTTEDLLISLEWIPLATKAKWQIFRLFWLDGVYESILPISHCLKITQNVAFEFLEFWDFPPIFVLLKLTCLVTLFDCKLQVFKNSPKWTVFGIFN